MRRTLYLVIFAVLIVALVAAGYYSRHPAEKPSAATPAAANCDTPAPPPPPPKPTEPKLPDFVEAGCGPAAPGAKPAPAPAKKK